MPSHRRPKKPPGQKKPALTHFLCLPLVTADSRPLLQASMNRFKDAVATKNPNALSKIGQGAADGSPTQETTLPCIHPKAIRPVDALHCTLGVMSLDKPGLKQAIKTLEVTDTHAMLRNAVEASSAVPDRSEQPSGDNKSEDSPASLERPISPPTVDRQLSPLTIDLKGLLSMHDPTKTSILYTAPTDFSERLYPFCLAVQKLFSDAALLVPDDRQLKLHATVVNTIYANGRKKRPPKPKEREETPEPEYAEGSDGAEARIGSKRPEQDDRSEGHGPGANAPLKVVATAILEEFKDFIWADNVILDRIAICEMGAKKIMDADGRVVKEEYKEVASVKLPSAAT